MSLLIFILRNRPTLTHLRCSLFIVMFCIALSPLLIAQADDGDLCTHVRQTGRAIVRGYTFISYGAINSDKDPACLRVYYDGKIVYTLANAEQRYYLGQPGDARLKIPRVPNGSDLTGEGRSDMIATSWSGGAHCCYTHFIFELEPKFRLLATIKDGDTDMAHFERLGQKNGYFYVTWDIWSYWPGSFASSVSHKVILRWNGSRFQLALDKMRFLAPTSGQWNAAVKDVDDALKDDSDAREELGNTLWDTTLDLIYTGHSDLAWKFVQAVNPKALQGSNPSLGEFCSGLKGGQYWPDLEPTLKDMPDECVRAKGGGHE